MKYVFKNYHAQVTMETIDDNEAVVHSFITTVPRQGYGRSIFEEMLTEADRKGFNLVLEAHRYGHARGMDNEQLRAFYESYGFEVQGRKSRESGYFMIRRSPSQEKHVP